MLDSDIGLGAAQDISAKTANSAGIFVYTRCNMAHLLLIFEKMEIGI